MTINCRWGKNKRGYGIYYGAAKEIQYTDRGGDGYAVFNHIDDIGFLFSFSGDI